MSSDIPEWVVSVCQHWGRAKRRLWHGAEWYVSYTGGRRRHVDGYAESFMGRLMEDKMGAGQGARHQHWPEVFGGDALDVQRILPGIPELPHAVLHLHYVFDPEFNLKVRQKAVLVEIRETRYWEALRHGQLWVLARLSPGAQNQVSDRIHEIARGSLSNANGQGTKAHTCRSSLDFTPLRRPLLTR